MRKQVVCVCVSAETLRMSDPGLRQTLHRPQLSAQTRQITLLEGATSQEKGTRIRLESVRSDFTLNFMFFFHAPQMYPMQKFRIIKIAFKSLF